MHSRRYHIRLRRCHSLLIFLIANCKNNVFYIKNKTTPRYQHFPRKMFINKQLYFGGCGKMQCTVINMSGLTPVAETGVTDAFCYRERWRTDSPSGKGEARRNRQHGVRYGITRPLCQQIAYRLCCVQKIFTVINMPELNLKQALSQTKKPSQFNNNAKRVLFDFQPRRMMW